MLSARAELRPQEWESRRGVQVACEQPCLYTWGLLRGKEGLLDSLLLSRRAGVMEEVSAAMCGHSRNLESVVLTIQNILASSQPRQGKSWRSASGSSCFGPGVAQAPSASGLWAQSSPTGPLPECSSTKGRARHWSVLVTSVTV